MDELTKSKIRVVLTESIDKVMQTEILALTAIDDRTSEIVAQANTSQIMAEAALQVLLAVADGQTYLEQEGYLRE